MIFNISKFEYAYYKFIITHFEERNNFTVRIITEKAILVSIKHRSQVISTGACDMCVQVMRSNNFLCHSSLSLCITCIILVESSFQLTMHSNYFQKFLYYFHFISLLNLRNILSDYTRHRFLKKIVSSCGEPLILKNVIHTNNDYALEVNSLKLKITQKCTIHG